MKKWQGGADEKKDNPVESKISAYETDLQEQAGVLRTEKDTTKKNACI